MKAKKLWISAVILFVSAGLVFRALAAEDITKTMGKITLIGLDGIAVGVSQLEPEIEKYGLTTQQIQTDVELRLRQNGIKVDSADEVINKPGKPLLNVMVSVSIAESKAFAVTGVGIELEQVVVLQRNPSIVTFAPTYRTRQEFNMYSVNQLASLRNDVRDLVDQFSNDYLAAQSLNLSKQSSAQDPNN